MAQITLNSTGVASNGALSLQSNGTTEAIGISTGQIATLAQNPILTSGTANGVGYLNASKVLTTGSALTFDGTNLGIGTSSPTVKLDVNGNVNIGATLNTGTGLSTGSATVEIGGSRTGDGNSYIDLHSVAGTDYETRIIRAGGQNGILQLYNTGTGDFQITQSGAAPILFSTSATERMRIDSAGNVLVGRTSVAGTAVVSIERPANTAIYIHQLKSGQVECTWGFKASTDSNMYIGSGSTNVGTYGVYLTNTGNSWNAVSDERKKTIVEFITNAAEKVSSLRAVIGYYNHDENQIRRPFLIAQDVQAVLPEAVNIQDEETGTLGMSYTDVIPLLVAAIKEQTAIIASLTARLDAANL